MTGKTISLRSQVLETRLLLSLISLFSYLSLRYLLFLFIYEWD